MRESKASRTLLKSPPELWSEVSTATALQRHMDQFGEIRITKLEPETAVAWEGEHARGTITLEVSGWGTKVSLTAEPTGNGAAEPTGNGAAEPTGNGAAESTGNGAFDATRPEAAVQAEPEAANDRVEPLGSGDRYEPVGSGERYEPEPTRYLAAAAAEAARVSAPTPAPAPAPMGQPVSALDPVPASAPASERPRWTRRVSETLKKWFSPPMGEEAQPLAHAPEPEPAKEPAPAPEPAPEPPAPRSTYAAPQFDRLVAPPTAPTPAQPAAQPEPAPQIDEASTAALDATLDSLGQAHHRPFSRA